MDSRRLLRSVSLLTVANLWASGSSFIMFAIAARELDNNDLGTLALMLACVQLVTYLADGGLTSYVVREVVRTDSLATFNWSLRRRALVAGVVSAPLALLTIGGTSLASIALVLAASVANSWYSGLVAVLFVVGEPKRVIVVQAINGGLFVLLGLVAGWLWHTPTGFLTMVLVSYSILLAWEHRLLRSTWGTPQDRPPLRGQAPFIVSGLAYGANSVVDSLMLGRQSALMLAEYAGAQRAALGASAFTRAASGLLLPRFARRPAAFPPRHVLYASMTSLTLGGLVGFALTPVINAIYMTDLTSAAVMSLLFAVFGLDFVLVLTSANLIARGSERALAAVALGQLAVTALGVALLVPHGPIGVAGAVMIGRLVGLGMMLTVRGVDRA